MPNASLSTETDADDAGSNPKRYRSNESPFLCGTGASNYQALVQDHQTNNPHITLTKTSGRAAEGNNPTPLLSLCASTASS